MVARSLECFSDFINGNKLIDIPLFGAKLTWSNKQDKVTMSRIDQFLISKDWEDCRCYLDCFV